MMNIDLVQQAIAHTECDGRVSYLSVETEPGIYTVTGRCHGCGATFSFRSDPESRAEVDLRPEVVAESIRLALERETKQ
jgi:hypothetical protein